MKSCIYTINKHGRLVGIQDIDGWEPDEIAETFVAIKMSGATPVLSTCGRRRCSVCRIDIGPKEGLAAGEITHDYCKPHYLSVMEKISDYEKNG